ncbi:hypothetical protein ASE12_05770 [Aeromicrobium sp. Root236]|uniref:hypothetical protein n=1 Tax=Aeromicrobium sp. Root236 TaxID=1736498 RepID=UPI0006FA13C7|nr:hypothetical protein [Aeromicrobium sp. Root236]KRC64318.1 hypothetical protein ASE12_05770 [Aeromicrobium sp. Root236]
MTSSLIHTSTTGRSWWPLTRHYVEMVIAMSVGMLVLGVLRSALGLTVELADRPGTSYLLMATDMAIGMAAWMRFRGHAWAMTAEMCAAMYVPAVLLPLVWIDVMSPMAFMVVAHTVMMVAMLVVLVRRRHDTH